MTPAGGQVTRVDLHCHSTASTDSKLAVQRALGLPECATPPQEVYELAKRRGMDFVTITDHDTIDGCLEIAERPDAFISEELTAWLPGTAQAVHILCYGITAGDHAALQERAGDVEECVAYIRERGIVAALAHPFFAVAEPLDAAGRRRLSGLFGIWEVRNGSRAGELNQPAAIYAETNGAVGIGGSDDHAGVDIGRTWTETPPASTPEELLDHLRSGRAVARGVQGSAARWAHSALALGARALAAEGSRAAPDPRRVLHLAERVVRDGAARGGKLDGGLNPEDARALLAAWLESIGLAGRDAHPMALVRSMQADGFDHSELYRRARRVHEARLRDATRLAESALSAGDGYEAVAAALLGACVPAIPYAPAVALLGRERANLLRPAGERGRAALVADGAAQVHGVSGTIERIREIGVPGFDVEVIGTDACVDRRLPAVAEVEVPLYPGMRLGVPSLPDIVEALADGRYDLVHVTAPGPAGLGAALAAHVAGLPLVTSHHTELPAYVSIRGGDPRLAVAMRILLATLYERSAQVLSPSPAADHGVDELGVPPQRLARWSPGVDLEAFDPSRAEREFFPGEVKVLYAGRIAREKGIDLLADAFACARVRDPRLHLLVAGGGPEEEWLRSRLGDDATFLGWLDRGQLGRAYASADLFLFCSRTDTYGQVISEAQASGLAVIAVAEGGPASLIRHRRTGWLCPPDAGEIAAAIAQLASSRFLRSQIAAGGLEAARERTWPASMAELAAGYDRALAVAQAQAQVAQAA